MIRTFPVDTDRLALLATGHVEPVHEWVERDGRRQPADEQSRDETTGLLLWTVHALVMSGDRPELVAVRLPARDTPEVDAQAPVRFERLECRVSVNRSTGALSGYWAAAGLAATPILTKTPAA